MAVAVASVDPTDGAIEIMANAPLEFELTDTADLDLSLAELVINGESFTVANGGLVAYNIKDIVGGVIVDDRTDVFFRGIGWWYKSGVDEVDWEIFYNSASLDTGSFTVMGSDILGGNTTEEYQILPGGIMAGLKVADLDYVVRDLYGTVIHTNPTIEWNIILSPAQIICDCDYLIGTVRLERNPGSGIVGIEALDRHWGSGIVRGYAKDGFRGSGIVQGYIRDRQPGSGIVGIEFRYRHLSSGIVGVVALSRVPGSGVVYGVNRANVLEVHVISEEAYAALVAAGITFS